METVEQTENASTILAWNLNALRTVRYEPSSSTIYSPRTGITQHVYHFDEGYFSQLAIRRSQGLPYRGCVQDMVWLRAYTEEGNELKIGLESAYIFERTACLITPNIALKHNSTTIPVYDILVAVLHEVEALLGFRSSEILEPHEVPEDAMTDYLAIDHNRTCKLIVTGARQGLDSMETQARTYCSSFWKQHESMGERIFFDLDIGFYPTKRTWKALELADLEQGDLLALQNGKATQNSRCIRGFLRFNSDNLSRYKYEVNVEMNDHDTSLQFAGEARQDPRQSNQDPALAPHEQIELEIHAGKTRIPFNELCAVQNGTLIELSEHALPMVTLCVNGSPILEGELVHFQDQLMVQITKRLD